MRQRSDTRDELGFGEEMVLVKMLMDIDPLSMIGSLVMTMVSIISLSETSFPGRTAPPEP